MISVRSPGVFDTRKTMVGRGKDDGFGGSHSFFFETILNIEQCVLN